MLLILCSARVPNVAWAERSDRIFITIEVSDCPDAKVDIAEDGHLSFKGTGGTDKATYECQLQLFKPVNSKASYTDDTLSASIPVGQPLTPAGACRCRTAKSQSRRVISCSWL